jgi:predicted RND superfamily exporter protein
MKRYIEWVVRYRYVVIALTLLATVLAVSQARNLKIIIDPNTMMPQSHPYVSTTNLVENTFGSKFVVVVGITANHGDIYQPMVLEKVQRITAAMLKADGVVQENILSLSARRAKDIRGNDDGMEVRPLMPSVPTNEAQIQELRDAIKRNPAYLNAIVSTDGTTAAIIAEWKNIPGGFRAIQGQVDAIVELERDEGVEIFVSGLPNYLSRIESYSERMGFLLPIAILVLSLVLFEAFRTVQGMLLPLVTAILAVAWGVGVMGAFGIPLDVFNATTPILILAVATGHAVQMLKRYYEEYFLLRKTQTLSPKEANDLAVINALVRIGPVMITAGMVAALGFFSLVVFDISTIRTFGVFTGVGILAAMMLEMTFIPALRSVLKPPSEIDSKRERSVRVWDHITGAIAALVTGIKHNRIYVGAVVFVVIALAGMSQVVTNNSTKSFFSPELQFQRDDDMLNERLSGANTLYVLIEGETNDAIKNPVVLQAMSDMQQLLNEEPEVGKTVSIADFVKRMNQAMHSDDAAFYRIPDKQELISQYLLLYSISGEPGDFDSYVDYEYRMANLTVFMKTDSTAVTEQLIGKISAFANSHLPPDVKVRFGGQAQGVALNDMMVHDKILNILQIASVVFLISSIVFRSFVAGSLVLLPLLLTVLAIFGLMGWSNIYLNISTALTSAMAVGIGADYAIYVIFRLREELDNGVDEYTAVRNVITTAGKAVLFVAIAVAAGYGVLLTSFDFNLHKWLAILIATAMIVSAFSTLLLIPALILRFRPNFIFRRGV